MGSTNLPHSRLPPIILGIPCPPGHWNAQSPVQPGSSYLPLLLLPKQATVLQMGLGRAVGGREKQLRVQSGTRTPVTTATLSELS